MLNRRHIRLKIMQLIYALKISDFNYDTNNEKQLGKIVRNHTFRIGVGYRF